MALVDDGKRRALNRWLSSTKETSISLSWWLSETRENRRLFLKGILRIISSCNKRATTVQTAATREKSSGCNENDVLKRAHDKKKFILEHAWKELRNDQKWCDFATAKNDGGSKKRKCDNGADSSSSQATESKHLAGVKAAKARGKKTMAEDNALNGFQRMWDIK
uniref:No apical meristem-associated C-terminal domain-containing protein n=1 Tax=Brassica oleracea var. oleracea TaxID=109376 RepID=A0A0D3BRV8_BRAOL